MSDPGYGDLCVKNIQDPERVIVMCFVTQGNETPVIIFLILNFVFLFLVL